MAKQLVEVWIVMNQDGKVYADDDRENAMNNMIESGEEIEALRVVCVQVMMSPPDCEVVEVEVPDEAPGTDEEVKVASAEKVEVPTE